MHFCFQYDFHKALEGGQNGLLFVPCPASRTPSLSSASILPSSLNSHPKAAASGCAGFDLCTMSTDTTMEGRLSATLALNAVEGLQQSQKLGTVEDLALPTIRLYEDVRSSWEAQVHLWLLKYIKADVC